MHVTKRIDLDQLGRELTTAGVAYNGLGHTGTDIDGDVYTFTTDLPGAIVDLPPEAQPVVAAHMAPPRLVEFAGSVDVHAIVRTIDAVPLEVFRFPCEQRRGYEATLTISGIDAGNGAMKVMEGRFAWKRLAAGALVVGLTIVSDVHDAAAASWAPNFHVETNDIVFTVSGAAGRSVDWLLIGAVGTYAPSGLTAV